MLAPTPAVFFALGGLAPAGAGRSGGDDRVLRGGHPGLPETLVAIVLVAVVALREVGGGRRAMALAALTVALGAVATFAAAPVLGAVVGGQSADCSASPVTAAMPSRTTRGVGDPARAPGGALRGPLDRAGGRRAVVAARAGRARRRRPGAARVRRPGRRAGVQLRLRPARWGCCAAGPWRSHGRRLEARPPGPVHGARHALPATGAAAGRLTPAGSRTAVSGRQSEPTGQLSGGDVPPAVAGHGLHA